jgi:hypothetical protein
MNEPLQAALLLQNRLLDFMSLEEFQIFVIGQASDYAALLHAAVTGKAFLVRRTPNGFTIKIA